MTVCKCTVVFRRNSSVVLDAHSAILRQDASAIFSYLDDRIPSLTTAISDLTFSNPFALGVVFHRLALLYIVSLVCPTLNLSLSFSRFDLIISKAQSTS